MKNLIVGQSGGPTAVINSSLYGVIREGFNRSEEIEHVYGMINGIQGFLDGRFMDMKELDNDTLEALRTTPGAYLGSCRFKLPDDLNDAIYPLLFQKFEEMNIGYFFYIGGNDSMDTVSKLSRYAAAHNIDVRIMGIPKTIDNDLSCTDWTFGFDTASNIAMEEIDRLHTTAESHERCFVVECMGRHTGWITLQAGVAANAHLVLIPEFPMSFDEIYDLVRSRYLRGERYTIIAVAEGFELTGEKLEELERDMFGNVLLLHRELARHLADRIEKAIRSDETLDKRREHFEARSVVLGHLQRGGAPSAFDRMLGTRMGVKAGDLVVSGEYGNMVSLRGTEIAVADLDRAVTERKKVGKELYDVATLFY